MPRCGAWEVDLSFPSAHTQFFAGLFACASTLAGPRVPLAAAVALGAVIGFTRNYLSVHWPTDTLAALALGTATGFLWGTLDPYARLLALGSPAASLYAATGLTAALLALLLGVRKLVPPVPAVVASAWYENALASLAPEDRAATLANPRMMLTPRSLRSKIPMLVTVWATLALTAVYPTALPLARLEPLGRTGGAQALVGLGGLGAVAVIKAIVERLQISQGAKAEAPNPPRIRNIFKGLTCARPLPRPFVHAPPRSPGTPTSTYSSSPVPTPCPRPRPQVCEHLRVDLPDLATSNPRAARAASLIGGPLPCYRAALGAWAR